jgi:flagellar biogenesis protein FliO
MEINAADVAMPSLWIKRGFLKIVWQWIRRAAKARKPRRLRVCETLSLGDRRFLAVIEFDRQEFLVGGTGSSLEVLARLQQGTLVPEVHVPGNPAYLEGR